MNMGKEISKLVVDNETYALRDDEARDDAMKYDTLGVEVHADKAEIYGESITGSRHAMEIPAATTEKAGVMSATDKVTLDKATTDIKANADAIVAERTRAMGQEGLLNNAIVAEQERAEKHLAAEVDKLKDGDTIAGQAREIHSRNGKTVTDSFLVRTTAGSGTIGDGVASLKSVGGNIVKNLVDGTFTSGWTAPLVKIGDGVAVITPRQNYDSSRYKDIPCVANHKYYIRVLTCAPGASSHYIAILGYGDTTKTIATVYRKAPREQWGDVTYILTAPAEYRTLGLSISADANTGVIAAAKPYFIDLTEMFGAGNEPDQATCDRLFGTMDALPQGLSIAKPTEFKSTGFNQFNPDNILDGKAIIDNAIESGDKKIAVIPCLPCKVGTGENNGYCIHGDFGEDIKVYLTPLNPMEVDGELYMHELTKDATTDTYVPLIKGYMLVEVPTTANLCAHFLWSEDKCDRDSYEPYHESKVELPVIPQISEWGLAGIQAKKILAADTIDFERMIYTKRIGCVDLGSLSWTAPTEGDAAFLSSVIKDIKPSTYSSKNNLICEPFTVVTNSHRNNPYAVENSIWVHADHKNRICVLTSKYTDSTSIKAALQGVMLYYELATPEEYPLPKVDNNYISSDYGVEQFDGAVPCNTNNLYYMRSLAGETRNFLDRLMAGLGTDDATVVADRILAVVNPAPANVEPETPIES